MKYPVALCVILVGVAFGMETDLGHRGPYPDPSISQIGFPSTDDAIVSQPFLFRNMTNALACNASSSYMIADDATPAGSMPLGIFQFCALYTGSVATTWKIQARNHAAGPGTTVLWTAEIGNVVNTATSLYAWGYPLFACVATPTTGQLYSPVAGTKIWLCFQSLNGSAMTYFCAANQTWADQCFFSQNNGSTWTSSTAQWGVAYELTMIVSTPVALEHDTWGSIKSTF